MVCSRLYSESQPITRRQPDRCGAGDPARQRQEQCDRSRIPSTLNPLRLTQKIMSFSFIT